MNGGSTFSVPRSAGLDLGLVRLEHMERIRLLIVDDEDAFRRTVAKRLMFFLYLARWLQLNFLYNPSIPKLYPVE